MRSRIAFLAAVVFVVLIAPAAQAGQHTRNDGSGDMHRLYDYEMAGDAPSQVKGDITRVQIKHNRRYIQLFMTFRDLGSGVGANFLVQNGRHQNRSIFVGARPTGTYGLQITKFGSNAKLRCRGTRGAAVNAATHTLAVTFPRTCFNNPRFVRLNAWAENGDGADHPSWFIDDAMTADYLSHPQNPYTSFVVWTPWVKRG